MTLQDLRAALVGRTLCYDDDGIPAAFRVADVLAVALDGYTLVAAADREAAAPTGSTLTLPAATTLALITDGSCTAGGVLYTLEPLTPPRGMEHDTVSAALSDAIIGRVVTFRGASGITLRFTVDGDDDDDEPRYGDIARSSIEGLALTGEGVDSEYGLRYYTAERLVEEDAAIADLLEKDREP